MTDINKWLVNKLKYSIVLLELISPREKSFNTLIVQRNQWLVSWTSNLYTVCAGKEILSILRGFMVFIFFTVERKNQ